MGWKSTYANRGMDLEKTVEDANFRYRHEGVARIDKVPTPIRPIKIFPDGKIYGFTEKKSTVDYTGVIKGGTAIAFDCKETSTGNLPLANIYEHQIEYLEEVKRLEGIPFLIVSFKKSGKIYRLDFETLINYWNASKAGGRKSIPECAMTFPVESERLNVLHYLKGLV